MLPAVAGRVRLRSDEPLARLELSLKKLMLSSGKRSQKKNKGLPELLRFGKRIWVNTGTLEYRKLG